MSSAARPRWLTAALWVGLAAGCDIDGVTPDCSTDAGNCGAATVDPSASTDAGGGADAPAAPIDAAGSGA